MPTPGQLSSGATHEHTRQSIEALLFRQSPELMLQAIDDRLSRIEALLREQTPAPTMLVVGEEAMSAYRQLQSTAR